MGQSTQEWAKQNLWKTAFKKFEEIWSELYMMYMIVIIYDLYYVYVWMKSLSLTTRHFFEHKIEVEPDLYYR